MNNLKTFNRPKLGVLFNFSSKWMGGVNYIINIVNTLNYLDEGDKPEIFLFYRADLARFINEMQYPYLNKLEYVFPRILQGTIKSMIIRRNLFIYSILKEYSLDAIFPLQDYPVRTRTRTKLVSWCADFQHRHYPEFFSKTQILGRNTRTKLALRNNDDLVISSYDASTDLKKYFRVRDGLNIHIFHFVSVINDLGSSNFDEIKAKYKLPDKYFLVSNQFHKHKNHKVLLQALVKLKKMDIITHMAMTGKFPDKTNAPYLKDLQNLINENFLTDQVTMLGVISRREQLILMKNSQAVLQPSLFEGWSTVIEDAKSLQVPVVASNIKVNIEQLGENGVYFDPHNPYELAAILKGYPERNMNDVFYEEYHQRIKNAARELLDILLPS